jgi:hypothetical protein
VRCREAGALPAPVSYTLAKAFEAICLRLQDPKVEAATERGWDANTPPSAYHRVVTASAIRLPRPWRLALRRSYAVPGPPVGPLREYHVVFNTHPLDAREG